MSKHRPCKGASYEVPSPVHLRLVLISFVAQTEIFIFVCLTQKRRRTVFKTSSRSEGLRGFVERTRPFYHSLY